MLFLQATIVNRRPLCPTFVHDDATRLAICVVGVILCVYLHYRILRHFNGP